MSLEFTKKETRFDNKLLCGALAELSNAVIAFFWEGKEAKFGTLTITLPDRSSSHLLGDRNRQLGQILGAQLSKLTNKIALVSVYMPIGVGDIAGRILLDLTRELIDNEKEIEDG